MVNIIKEEILVEDSLKNKLEFMCDFCKVKYTIINANEQLKEKNNKIRTLTKNNKALNLRVESLNNIIKEKNKEISRLNSIITDIKSTLNY